MRRRSNCQSFTAVGSVQNYVQNYIHRFSQLYTHETLIIPADFPKTFGLDELTKGYFPYLFNKKENENYVGPIPPNPFYHPDGMAPMRKKGFLNGMTIKKKTITCSNVQQEIQTYCCSDIDILIRCCLEFRELLRDVTGLMVF